MKPQDLIPVRRDQLRKVDILALKQVITKGQYRDLCKRYCELDSNGAGQGSLTVPYNKAVNLQALQSTTRTTIGYKKNGFRFMELTRHYNPRNLRSEFRYELTKKYW